VFGTNPTGLEYEGQVTNEGEGGRGFGSSLGGFNVGFLDMQTRGISGVTPANNFAVARVSRELPNRSRVGALFVNRQASTSRPSSSTTA
jgi:hypothetical protein